MKNKPYPLYSVEAIGNLGELLTLVASKYGEKPAISYCKNKETVTVSYAQLKDEAAALGAELQHLGIQREKIAIIGENSYEWILSYFATVISGNVAVPLDKELPASDICTLLEDCDAKIFVYSESYSDICEHLKEANGPIRHYFNMHDIHRMVAHGRGLLSNEDATRPNSKIDKNDLAAILYTSGTTGKAKGVMLSHYNIARNACAACEYIEILGGNMLVLPLHHSFGFTAGVCSMLIKGSRIYINSSLKHVLPDLQKSTPTNLLLVPLFVESFYNKIWDSAKKSKKEKLLAKMIQLSNGLLRVGIDIRAVLFKSVREAFGGKLKLIICGGAPLDSKYIRGMRDFGVTVVNGYGITECSPIVSVNRNHHYRDGSIGAVLPCCQVYILNPNEAGQGEILVKGDIVMLGYYNNPQATEEAFDGEWFRTGDMGYLDDDGFLYISGRKKNMIILSNGKNVYPEALEFEILNQIPYVKEVVVFNSNGLIAAEMYLDTENFPACPTLLEEDILHFNQSRAPYQSINKTILRKEEFPKTTTKKIKRLYKDGGSL